MEQRTIKVRQKMPEGIKVNDPVATCFEKHPDREMIWIKPEEFTPLFRSQFPTIVGAMFCQECIEEMKRERVQ